MLPTTDIKNKPDSQTSTNLHCFHCGEDCDTPEIHIEDKVFCCDGCKMVYEILNENDLCTYYNLESKRSGISLKTGKDISDYEVLDDADVRRQLIDYEDDTIVKATFYMPQIHCTACIWLLENLYKLHPGIAQSKVNFLKKETYITFHKSETTLREVVRLLASIGYAPEINLKDIDGDEPKKTNTSKTFFYKLGVAGFVFGNIMLLSFPEYLGLNKSIDGNFARFFSYLNILLALPVLFYSATEYYQSAWLSLKQKRPNIDVPITLGISVLFARSIFEILSQTGAGYLDSMAGLVFFLLIGKWFQRKTYDTITFERDYKSYFPISATRKTGSIGETVALTKLEKGDTIIVKNQELIPSDAILITGRANIDYSFVTGEAEPIRKKIGETIYAGGRQIGDAVEVTLTKKVSQSYLTQLWNDDAFTKPASNFNLMIDKVGQTFTVGILIVAAITGIYWLINDASVAINAFTAVLIIACPCALALNIPFALGNALRILGKNKFYLKNTDVLERMNNITDLVFDKTGTLTSTSNNQLIYEGTDLTNEEQILIKTLAEQSSHPVSKEIVKTVDEKRKTKDGSHNGNTSTPQHLNHRVIGTGTFKEIIGQGISAIVGENAVRIGSEGFIFDTEIDNSRGTFIEINGVVKGFFTIKNTYRFGIENLIIDLQKRFNLSLLSGDNDRERGNLGAIFSPNQLHFNQKPADKLAFIKNYQNEGKKVMMLGDGLNDAGALKQSEVGIAVSENLNQFSPACDAILDAENLPKLSLFIHYAKRSMTMVRIGFVLSLAYNIVGLSFAVQGLLAPVIAAVLMPLSSVTVVFFGMVSTSLLGRKLGL
jgi:Cu+-exporting ATPase